jgi:hypothetical protein
MALGHPTHTPAIRPIAAIKDDNRAATGAPPMQRKNAFLVTDFLPPVTKNAFLVVTQMPTTRITQLSGRKTQKMTKIQVRADVFHIITIGRYPWGVDKKDKNAKMVTRP